MLLVGVAAALPAAAVAEQASDPTSPAAGHLTAGVAHTCALNAATVRCWGLGRDGQLGYGNVKSIGDDEAPSAAGAVDLDPLPGPGTAQAISAGTFHTCALLDGGAVRCWGFGGDGRLGYGNKDLIGDDESPGSAGPVDLDPGPGTGAAKAITAGDGHSCAILTSGAVQCWGFNLDGRLGYGNTDAIGDTEPPSAVGAVDLEPGAGTGTAFAITAGGAHTCAILDGGAVRCWGLGGSGRLGYGNIDPVGRTPETTPDLFGPVDLDPGPGTGAAKAISAGRDHTCAILTSGSVRCWGAGGSGQLGYGSGSSIGDNETPETVGPVDLGLGRTAKAIRAGGEHTCALLDDDTVRCWGVGTRGRLGYGNEDSLGDFTPPSSVGVVDLDPGSGPGSAKAITAALTHSCARLTDDSVRCWGQGLNGRLGYCNEISIGDNELPAVAGPVDLGVLGIPGRGCPPVSPPAPTAPPAPLPPATAGDPLVAQSARAAALATCLGVVATKSKAARRAAAKLPAARRRAARRSAARRAASGRRACVRLHGRVPGRVAQVKARATGRGRLQLSFPTVGTDGVNGPGAHTYLVKQSRRPIRTARAFAKAPSLCKGKCSFQITQVGASVTLTVTGLSRGTVYFAVAARDNVSGRKGPRSGSVRARVR